MNGRGGGTPPPSAALPGDLSETAQAVAIARASDAVMVEVSDGFCALVGRPRAEILGKTAAQLGISDRTRLDWLIDRFPERGRSHRQRRVFETPDGPRLAELDIHGIELGGERMIVSVISPVPAGEPHGDAEVLAAVLEAAPLGMVLFGPDLRIVRVNRAVERIGTIRPEQLGVRLLDAFPQVSPEIVAAVEGVFAGGDPVVGLESAGVDGRAYLLTMFPCGLRSTRSSRSAACSSTCLPGSSPSGLWPSASRAAARSWPPCCRPRRWSAAASPSGSRTTPSR